MIKNIIIITIIILILVLISFDIIYRYFILKKFYGTYLWTSQEMNYLTSISAPIRAGKTTLMLALHHLLTMKIIDDLHRKMQDIEDILIDVNFLEIKNRYYQLMEDGLSYDQAINKIIQELTVEYSDEVGFVKNLDKLHFNYLKNESHLNLITKWLYYLYHSTRNNYVFCNIKAWNQITSSYSLDFKTEWIKLKNNWSMKQSKDFPLEEFSVFMFDDQLIENSNNSATAKLNEDSGTDLFYRLFGQIFRESSYYLTTLQNAERWFKSEREIIQQHIYIWDRQLKVTNPVAMWFNDVIQRFNDWIYHFYKDPIYINSNNHYKRIRYRCINRKAKAISKGFLKYEVGVYDSLEQIGKYVKPGEETKSSYNLTLLVPVVYSWNIANTHFFHAIYDYMKAHSDLDIASLPISKINVDDIDELLKKYKEKTSSAIKEF